MEPPMTAMAVAIPWPTMAPVATPAIKICTLVTKGHYSYFCITYRHNFSLQGAQTTATVMMLCHSSGSCLVARMHNVSMHCMHLTLQQSVKVCCRRSLCKHIQWNRLSVSSIKSPKCLQNEAVPTGDCAAPSAMVASMDLSPHSATNIKDATCILSR